jgi:predicted regulator of Ras-like GTPase activity (Roadblock/LC7/MglB family)
MIAVATRLPTAFSNVLRGVVERVPGARGAIFLDSEGESIDEFSENTVTGVRLVGAHVGIVLGLARDRQNLIGRPEEIIVETANAILIAQAIDERYLVVLEASHDAPLGLMRHALSLAAASLRAQL